uniref:Uncharacterized protein n=1 Tax=Gloeothece verrucosa (strain PCC 7822) TaxID=497965 RepID=E0U8B0_GLOV7|nr:hypothetical protein Cyan7822_0504 [Gloeothece verrucosa PCC 7822]
MPTEIWLQDQPLSQLSVSASIKVDAAATDGTSTVKIFARLDFHPAATLGTTISVPKGNQHSIDEVVLMTLKLSRWVGLPSMRSLCGYSNVNSRQHP